MLTKDHFMRYFNSRAFIAMNSIYGANKFYRITPELYKVYHDTREFLYRFYHNIDDSKNITDGTEFVKAALNYLEDWKNSTNVYDDLYDKITNMHGMIKATAIDGGFIEGSDQ